ncbi:MAG: hypothetical protein ABI678_15950 [Kofleriaceae bacterium]
MEDPVPARVREYAEQAVAYVRRAVGVALEYDSDTLPLLDHYLRQVMGTQPETLKLVIATAGADVAEVVRRRLGGRWETTGEEAEWRVVLPTGLNFSPLGFVASAIAVGDVEDFDSALDTPARMRPYVEQALGRMGELPVDDYYSLCGRLDTLEHLHEVLVAVAAQMMGTAADPDGETDDGPEPVADEPSGPVN